MLWVFRLSRGFLQGASPSGLLKAGFMTSGISAVFPNGLQRSYEAFRCFEKCGAKGAGNTGRNYWPRYFAMILSYSPLALILARPALNLSISSCFSGLNTTKP